MVYNCGHADSVTPTPGRSGRCASCSDSRGNRQHCLSTTPRPCPQHMRGAVAVAVEEMVDSTAHRNLRNLSPERNRRNLNRRRRHRRWRHWDSGRCQHSRAVEAMAGVVVVVVVVVMCTLICNQQRQRMGGRTCGTRWARCSHHRIRSSPRIRNHSCRRTRRCSDLPGCRQRADDGLGAEIRTGTTGARDSWAEQSSCNWSLFLRRRADSMSRRRTNTPDQHHHCSRSKHTTTNRCKHLRSEWFRLDWLEVAVVEEAAAGGVAWSAMRAPGERGAPVAGHQQSP
eukprot:2428354-Prymnesium_polylepis.1